MAPSKTPTLTFDTLMRQIKNEPLCPLYVLHGEEGYFIDALIERFIDTVPEADRDFNLFVFYAPEVEMETVVDTCRRYPMMSDRLMVIVKEAQAVPARNLATLVPYINHLNPTTTLVVAMRGEKVRADNALLKATKAAGGTIFESVRLKNPTEAIRSFVTDSGLTIEPKGLAMLADYVGSDLSKLYNEVAKLKVALPAGACVTPEAIERHIGMSRQFNVFELRTALGDRDAYTAFRILDYFRSNPKNNNPIPIVERLWDYFSNLLMMLYSKDRSEKALCALIHSQWLGTEYKRALQNYNAWQLIDIIHQLRLTDAAMKGNGSRQDAHDLLFSLVHRILSTSGR